MSLRRGRLPLLAIFSAAGLLACGDSGPESVETRSAPLSALESLPLAGVLVSDCTMAGAAGVDSEVPLLGSDTAGLIGIPSLASVVSSDLGEFLVVLGLHAEELPVVSVLAPDLGDPAVLVPLPIDEALRVLPPAGIPLDTTVLGSTTVGCDEDPAAPLGLVPILANASG